MNTISNLFKLKIGLLNFEIMNNDIVYDVLIIGVEYLDVFFLHVT